MLIWNAALFPTIHMNFSNSEYHIPTRPTLGRRKTFGLLRSINPNMINHFANQPQTCQHLKILKTFLNIETKLWKVVQLQVELIRINFKFEAPILIQVQIVQLLLSISLKWKCFINI